MGALAIRVQYEALLTIANLIAPLSKAENPFSVFSLLTHKEINILLFGVFMILGKQKTPGDIPPGVFCFPQGKQKTPSAIHNLNQSII